MEAITKKILTSNHNSQMSPNATKNTIRIAILKTISNAKKKIMFARMKHKKNQVLMKLAKKKLKTNSNTQEKFVATTTRKSRINLSANFLKTKLSTPKITTHRVKCYLLIMSALSVELKILSIVNAVHRGLVALAIETIIRVIVLHVSTTKKPLMIKLLMVKVI